MHRPSFHEITMKGFTKGTVCSIAVLSFVALALGISTHADAGMITDDFNVAHDYSGGNVAGTIWDGIRYDEGNISGVVANANTTSAGQLYFESANGEWSAADHDGLLLYKNVAGDFVADVQATSATNGNYNGVGLMARLADPAADGDAGEDWMFLSYSTRFSQNRVRKVDNSANTQILAASEQPFLQIERLGDVFIFRRKANAGDVWAQIDLVTRADLNGLALQVGIWQADFDSIADSGTLDNFSLSGPNVGGSGGAVPEPAALLLALLGLALLPRRRRR